MVKEEKIERLDIHSHFPAYRPRKDIYGVIKGRHRLGQPEKAITPKAKFLFFFSPSSGGGGITNKPRIERMCLYVFIFFYIYSIPCII